MLEAYPIFGVYTGRGGHVDVVPVVAAASGAMMQSSWFEGFGRGVAFALIETHMLSTTATASSLWPSRWNTTDWCADAPVRVAMPVAMAMWVGAKHLHAIM